MSTLAEILTQKLIPWTQHNASERFIVAQSKMNAKEMPFGVQLIPHKIIGKRVVVKNLRYYENTRGTVARWPEAKLNEVNKLKLMCVLDGHINYQLGNYCVRCGAGNFLFMPPGTPHPDGRYSVVDAEKSTFCDTLFFLLHPHALQCWVNSSKLDRGTERKNYLFIDENVGKLFQIFMEETISGGDSSFYIGGHLLAGFCSVLLREIVENRVQSVFGEDPNATSRTQQQLSSSKDFSMNLQYYVQAHLHKTLTLDVVARKMFLSRAQFTRVVRRETGKSFNQFLVEQRITKAKNLLRESDWTVDAISIFVGFHSPSYFNTVFKRHTGKTPVQYRVACHHTKKIHNLNQ